MSISANIRTWIGAGTGFSVRQFVKSKEHLLFLTGAAVIAVHLLTQAFIDPEPMSKASDNIVTGFGGPALVAAAALAYHRLATGFRALVAGTLGLFALITGLVIHVAHMVAEGATISDITALAAAGVGAVFIGMSLWLTWKALPRLPLKLALIPAVPIFFLQVIFPVSLATFVVNTPRQPLGDESPADYGLSFESVHFDNEDGDTLAAWYIPSESGAAVVLVHGAGKNRTKTLDHAAMLAKNGYGALMVDMRGYGESDGSPIAFGWTGAEDVAAAVEYLKTRPDVDEGRIGALGLSMGGEIVLQATGKNDDIQAVVAEGPGARAWDEYQELPGGTLAFTAVMNMHNALKAVEILSGEDQPPSNKDLISEIAPRPVLLITIGSGEEGDWGRILAEAGPSVDLWETGGGHINGLDEKPVEYEARVIGLFDEALLGE